MLLLAKALRLLDGKHQLLLQLLVALIGRQVQTVKAAFQTRTRKTTRFVVVYCSLYKYMFVLFFTSPHTHTLWHLAEDLLKADALLE